jgi:hypothetical protein
MRPWESVPAAEDGSARREPMPGRRLIARGLSVTRGALAGAGGTGVPGRGSTKHRGQEGLSVAADEEPFPLQAPILASGSPWQFVLKM